MHRLILRRRGRRIGLAVLHARAQFPRPPPPRCSNTANGRAHREHSNCRTWTRPAAGYGRIRRSPPPAFLQHAALVHIFQQRRKARSSIGTMQILQRAEIRRMRIPGSRLGIAIRHRRPVHLHEPACPPRSAAAPSAGPAQRCAAIPLAHLRLVPSPDPWHRALCPKEPGHKPCRNTRQPRNSLSAFSRSGIEPLMPLSSSNRSFSRLRRNVLAQRQIFQFDRLVRVLIHAVRIVGLAQEIPRTRPCR